MSDGGEQHRGQEEPAHAQPPGVGDGAVPPGAADPLAPGVTVTVTVGVGLTCGLGGRTENRGLCRGGSITMPDDPQRGEVHVRRDQRPARSARPPGC